MTLSSASLALIFNPSRPQLWIYLKLRLDWLPSSLTSFVVAIGFPKFSLHLVIGKWRTTSSRFSCAFRGVEEGPPPTPDFLLNLLDESVGVYNRTEQEDWARPAFWAGFWAKAAIETDTSWSPQYRPDSPAYWVVLRGGDWEEPSVFESEAEVKRFVGKQPTDKHIIQPLIDYIEIFIFCSGASVGIPGRWLWTRRN